MEAVETIVCCICGKTVPVSPDKKLAAKKAIMAIQDTFGSKVKMIGIRCEDCRREMSGR